jgi:small subunit ribosomal protein S21
MGPPATPGPPAASPLLFGRSKVAQSRSNCLIFFREGADLFMQIIVRDNNVDQALRALKKKLQREGVYREMKLRRHYEKPSEKRAREKAAAIRRARKLDRKRAERDGQR